MEHHGAIARTLFVPELTTFVFCFLDKKDLSKCARVCKAWSEPALDALWKSMSSVKPLMRLLSPLDHILDSEDKHIDLFVDPIDPQGWTRFQKYSGRVKSLSARLNFESLDPSVYFEVATSRPSLEILPNLKELAVDCSGSPHLLRHSLIFMSQSISKLSIVLFVEEGIDSMCNYLEEVAFRLPRLKQIELALDGLHNAVRPISSQLAAVLSDLKELRSVTLTMYTTTSDIVSAISRLHSLTKVEIIMSASPGPICGDIKDVAQFSPRLEKDAFMSLSELSLSVSIRNATQFLADEFGPRALHKLHIYSPQLESADTISVFLSFLPRLAEGLTDLRIDAVPVPTTNALRSEANGLFMDHLSGASLMLLLQLPRLRSLSIQYHRALLLTDDDLEVLVKNLPDLEILSLSRCPLLIDERPHLTLAALHRVALHGAKIRRLSLYIDASSVLSLVDPISELCANRNPAWFSKLECLDLGVSHIDENLIFPAAKYISRLLPLKCKLNCTLSLLPWVRREVEHRILTEMFLRTELWHRVGEILPLLVETRAEERARTSKLKEDLGDLGYRYEVLKDQYVNGIWPNNLSPRKCIIQ